MCGRYGFGNPARLGTLPLGVELPPLTPRFNITPAQAVPLVRETAQGRDAVLARWGLVPFWADDPAIGNRMANARGDTVATKPSFRAAFRQRRGIMPADLFYEWQPLPGQKHKQPWCIGLPDRAPFALAALWEQWTPREPRSAHTGLADAAPTPLITCALITTEPNAVMAPIHDRMPVLLHPDDFDRWLNPATPLDAVQALIRPWDGPMVAWPVSTAVNSPRVDDPALIDPIEPHRPAAPHGDAAPTRTGQNGHAATGEADPLSLFDG